MITLYAWVQWEKGALRPTVNTPKVNEKLALHRQLVFKMEVERQSQLEDAIRKRWGTAGNTCLSRIFAATIRKMFRLLHSHQLFQPPAMK